MPQLFSYKSNESDPDNIWKIKRRVAKSLRAANDDDRGLAETADMSEETDDVLGQLGKILDKTINISNSFLNQKSKMKRPTDIINIPDFKFSILDSFMSDFKKVDVNKMNASNIEKITNKKIELEEFIGNISTNIDLFKQETSRLERAQAGRRRGAIGTPPSNAETLSIARQAELVSFFNFYDDLIMKFQDVLNQVDLKLSNYRQTARVLTQEGIEQVKPPPPPLIPVEKKEGGCMCDVPFQYRPEYQNQMYY